MFSLIHSRQQQRLLEGFYCCHLVQLPLGGPLVLIVQPCSINQNHGLAILKLINTQSETPQKTMEHHKTLYYLTSLWWH